MRYLLDEVEIGASLGHGRLRMVPLHHRGSQWSEIGFTLAEEAINQGTLRVTEVSEEGVVDNVLAINEADTSVLLLEGEELAGALQDRLLSVDVLIRPRSRIRIPVSCCEKGRWSSTRPDFIVGSYAPPLLRATSGDAVNRSLRARGLARADQGQVWTEIDLLLARTGAESETSAMSSCLTPCRDYLTLTADDLPCPENAQGVVALVNGEFVGLDLFDRASTLRSVWDRLVAGYAADSVNRPSVAIPDTTEIQTMAVLECLKKAEYATYRGVDLGELRRFETRDLIGSALVVGDTALHLSAFPRR